MAGYLEYKDSGIPWLGDIPAHWGIERGKNILTLLDRPVRADDEVITCFRDGEVTLRKNRREEGFTLSLQEVGYQGIEPGDLVVHGMDGFAGSIGVSDSRGKATPVLNVMDSPHNKRYLMYYLRMAAYKDVFLSLSTGIRVRSCDLRWNKLAVFPFVIPKRTEQDAVVEYIDRELAKADVIIAEAKASIEEYKAWKASIIYEAVTKGLAPNVEMKDSGVEWIGEMPTTWRTMRIKDLGDARNGLTYSPEDQVDEGQGTLVLRSSNVQGGKLAFSDNVYVGSEIPPELILQQGDILICSRNGSRKLIGKNAYIEEDNKYSFGAFMMALRPKIANKKYVYWLLNSGVFGYYLPMFFTSTINQLTRENFRNMVVPYCDDELVQQRIVEYLDAKVSKIDGIIEEKETLVADLEAYKKALIFEVVTGKRKVV